MTIIILNRKNTKNQFLIENFVNILFKPNWQKLRPELSSEETGVNVQGPPALPGRAGPRTLAVSPSDTTFRVRPCSCYPVLELHVYFLNLEFFPKE